jgi:hypothetical protein
MSTTFSFFSQPAASTPTSNNEPNPKVLRNIVLETPQGLSKSGRTAPQTIGCRAKLNSAHQQQDDQNHYNQRNTAARAITPTAAMRPGWQSADQQEDQHNQQNRRQTHDISPNAFPKTVKSRPEPCRAAYQGRERKIWANGSDGGKVFMCDLEIARKGSTNRCTPPRPQVDGGTSAE